MYKKWGGLLSSLEKTSDFETFRKESPLVRKVDSLCKVKTMFAFVEKMKGFSLSEINYLNSPLLDGLYKSVTRCDPGETGEIDRINTAPNISATIKRLLGDDKYLCAVKWLAKRFSPTNDEIKIFFELACSYGSTRIALFFWRRVSDPYQGLLNAAGNNHAKLIKIFLNRRPNLTFENKNSLMLEACEYGHISVVQILYNEMFCIESQHLFTALYKNNLEVAKFLMEKGLDPTDTHISLACKNDSIQMLEIIGNYIHTSGLAESLTYCTQYGGEKITKYLLEKNNYTTTALEQAFQNAISRELWNVSRVIGEKLSTDYLIQYIRNFCLNSEEKTNFCLSLHEYSPSGSSRVREYSETQLAELLSCCCSREGEFQYDTVKTILKYAKFLTIEQVQMLQRKGNVEIQKIIENFTFDIEREVFIL